MIVTVTGARGGLGVTTLAVALARRLAAVLVDTDGAAGGVDLWLGGESEPGVRWSGLELAGGALPAVELLAALPAVAGLRVLAADRADRPEAAALGQVLEILVGEVPVVVDLARGDLPRAGAAVGHSGLTLVVGAAEAAAAASAHVIVSGLRELSPAGVVGLVLVGGTLPAVVVEAAVGAAVLASVATPAQLPDVAAGLADALTDPAAVSGPARVARERSPTGAGR